MGPKAPTKADSEYSQLLTDYEILQRWDQDNIILLRSVDNNREYLLREFTFNDKREFEFQLDLLNKRKRELFGCSHLMQLERIVTHSEDQFCSTYFKIYALFQWESRSLDDQINERNLHKRKFQEKELWSIAGSSIVALSHLQKQSLKHQSLSSRSILLNEEGMVKIYDPLSSGSSSNYETLLAKRNTPHLYISPEEVDSLQAEENSPLHNPYKSDIWTLGMILLESGLSQYQDECYRDQWSRVHWETLQFNLNRFKQIYSPELSTLVDLMLSREESVRPDWIELEERLLKADESQRQSSRTSHATNQSDKQRIYQQIIYSEPARVSSAHPPAVIVNDPYNAAFKPKPQPVSSPAPLTTAFQHQPQPQLLPVNQVNPSFIDNSRPLRSVFPSPFYTTETKVDENLIFIPDQYSEVSDTPNRQDSYFNSLTKPKNDSVRELKHKQASAKAFTPYVPSQAQNPNLHDSLEFVVEKYRQGSEYRGQKWRGMRHGHGVFLYLDGGKYEGDWSFSKMQGHGSLYYQSGKLAYDGEWNDDQFSGKGILYNEYPELLQSPYNFDSLDEIEDFWQRYEGQFKSDLKHGKGVLYLSNGERFQGQFIGDIAQGPGVFVKKDGTKVYGRWSNNKMIE